MISYASDTSDTLFDKIFTYAGAPMHAKYRARAERGFNLSVRSVRSVRRKLHYVSPTQSQSSSKMVRAMQEMPDGVGLHIPGYECEIMRSTYRSGRSVTLWVFMCPYCLCWHPHKAEEGLRSHVCHSDEGKAAHKYGYYLRLGPSGPVAPYS